MSSRNEEFKASLLFHGTDSVLKPGDTIVPGAQSGKSNWVPKDTKAYATDDLGAATYFANEAANNASEAAQQRVDPRIYLVEPHDPSDVSTKPMQDVHTYALNDDVPTEVSSPSGFKVKLEVPKEMHPSLNKLQMKNMMKGIV